MATTTVYVNVGSAQSGGGHNTAPGGSAGDVTVTIDLARVTTRAQLLSAFNSIADRLSGQLK